ncbi:uncharacterized protein si:ch211-113e8.11 [Triplophysa dalaica]|uniref:uncharacterized protein si:ch211-113e8.11 n=1 Tax=Triplophysa dalaica TaxID=1582913 RepID=UPI0024DF3544|nr:uncharacterized protein si:ch211-113e8.11 [Triplophysa dalaica]
MNSLVGYVVSSESEDEERGEESRTESFKKADDGVEEKKGRNFLLESESSSESESGPVNEDEEEEIAHSSPEPLLTPSVRPHTHKLPPPPLGGSGSGGSHVGSSVFANPFKDMADERLNVLQKHVPLTLQARPTQIGGKRICVAYRKNGRCRFGSSCKFAHDSDLQRNRVSTSDTEPKDNATAGVAGTQGDSLASFDVDKEKDNDKNSEQRKKRKVGVNDSLIPPKRALKLYARLSHP